MGSGYDSIWIIIGKHQPKMNISPRITKISRADGTVMKIRIWFDCGHAYRLWNGFQWD